MAKGIDAAIESLATPWEGYLKGRVEEFIKRRLGELASGMAERLGWAAMSAAPNERGYYEILCFASKEAHDAWAAADDRSADDVAALVLTRIEIPISAEQGAVTMVSLSRAEGQGANITALDGRVVLRLTLSCTQYNPSDKSTEDTGEWARVRVQRRTAGGGEWSDIYSGTHAPGEIEIDVSGLLSDDIAYSLRVMATGIDSGKDSVWVNFPTVVKTSVTLELVTDTDRVQSGRDGLQLQLRHTGSVGRTLHVEAYDLDGVSFIKQVLSLGDRPSGDSAVAVRFTDSAANKAQVTTGGAHRIRAWIAVDSSGATTAPLEGMVLMDGGSSVAVALNRVASSVTNWAGEDALRWSAAVPRGATDNERRVRFTLESADGSRVYWSGESVAEDSVGRTLTVTPEIEGVETAVIAARLRVYVGESERPAHDIAMSIDNSVSLAPTSGADFVLDPRGRDNATAPARIINGVSGEEVESTFSGMTFSGDGWMEDDEGEKCLRVRAGSSVRIGYCPFADFSAGSMNDSPGVTVELDVRPRNVSDPGAPLVDISATVMAGGSELPVGFQLRGLDGAVMTTGNTTLRNQDIGLREGERVHIAVNVVPGLRSMGGKTLNVVRVFVDGVNSREFSYTGKGVLSAASDAAITIGGEGADVDVYGIRVYRRALGRDEILADRIAALPGTAAKRGAHAANAITAGGSISYELARERYNTLLWRGRYANYGNTKKDKFPGELTISIIGDKAHCGTITAMTEKGQGTSSMTYWRWNGQFSFGDESVWTDGLGVEHTDGYRLADGLPAARKLVGKANYASSPQSHKMGSCNLFNDLWRTLTANGTIRGAHLADVAASEGVRVAVPQKPFMLFVQEDGDVLPRFEGLMTFGPGKGDEPTFGFDATGRPGYLCIEGADNNMPLVMHRVPWTDSEVTLEDGEDFIYNGAKQLSVVGGAVSEANIGRFREAFNFVYLHYPDVRRFEGDASMLGMSAGADTSAHYWLDGPAAGAARYDLMRHDPVSGQWVNAGARRSGGEWERVNLASDPVTADAVDATLDGEAQNAAFVAARLRHFKEHAGEHFNVDELLYVMSFCKLIAASDNRGKNTYLYTDPETGLIGFQQDDLDTIFATNNTGQREKPYWVEEHDRSAESGAMYWNSERNGLYNAAELAYEGELRRMMGAILTAMRELAGGGTPMECMERYYFRPVEEAFPAVAYNETAEIRYEGAAMSAMQPGGYSSNTDPLSQSQGTQLGAERQWAAQRLDYIASWAGWGAYASADGTGSAEAVSFRSVANVDGSNHSYGVVLTAHNAMYPAFALGQTVTRGTTDGAPRRLMEGESGEFSIGTGDGNTNIYIDGANNIRDLGDWTGMALGETLTVSASRLRRFVADASQGEVCQFRPTGLKLTTPMLEELTLRGIATLGGTLDLSGCGRLRRLDLRGTSLTDVVLPEGTRVEEVRLPGTLTSLRMRGARGVKRLTIEDASHLQRLELDGSDGAIVRSVLAEADSAGAPLTRVSVGRVEWTEGVTVGMVRALARDSSGTGVSGRIALTPLAGNTPTFAEKTRWVSLWGNVDDPANGLHITYTVYKCGGVSLRGDTLPMRAGAVAVDVVPGQSAGNDLSGVAWELTLRGGARARLDGGDASGVRVNILEVADYGSAGEMPATPAEAVVTATVSYQDGSEERVSLAIGCYRREAAVGDYVCCDGTYGPVASGKTIVGVCFYVDPDNPAHRLCVSLKPLSERVAWGPNDIYTPGLKMTDNPGSAFIPAGLTGYSFAATHIFTDAEIMSEESPDGFAAYAVNDKYGRGEIGWTVLPTDRSALLDGAVAGASVPWGLRNTLAIIAHRDMLLGDSGVNLPTPAQRAQTLSSHNEMEALEVCISEAEATMKQMFPTQQFPSNCAASLYFHAASLCYHYQPTGLKEGEVLAECFRRHRWFLPTVGESVRLFWHYATAAAEHQELAQVKADKLLALPVNGTNVANHQGGACSPFVGKASGGAQAFIGRPNLTVGACAVAAF